MADFIEECMTEWRFHGRMDGRMAEFMEECMTELQHTVNGERKIPYNISLF
jgi:hypothetical protein